MKLSVVIPVYNSEQSIKQLIEQLRHALGIMSYEIILVNDGSTDNSQVLGEAIAMQHDEIQFISLSRNFTEHNAVMCGLYHSTGEYVVIMDDDFQNPPEAIFTLIDKIKEGYDVVYSRYEVKQHAWWRNIISRFNGAMARWLIGKPKGLYLSSFKIIHRPVVNEVVRYKGPFPYIDGLILRCTNNIGTVSTPHQPSVLRRSRYTLKKLAFLYLNMFFNFSILPIRVFTFIGALMFISGVLLAIWFVIEKMIAGEPPGWTSTVLIILLFSGFQTVFLGLIGEYIGKQYLDQNNTPQWVVRKRIHHKMEVKDAQ